MARSPAFNTITRSARDIDGGEALPSPYDALAAPANDDLITAALSMWPTGPAWGSPDGAAVSLGSMLARFTRVLLDPFVWLYARAFALTREASLQGITELLPEWENDHGLPEPCFALTEQTTAQRMMSLSRKVRAEGVNHPEEFVRLALDYGFEIEIEEPAIFECGFSEIAGRHTVGPSYEETYWIVRVRDTAISYFEAGVGEAGYDPLFSFGASEQLLCLLRKMAPAWTLPVLAPWINYAAIGDGTGRVLGDEHGNIIGVII
ncbi:hypothetical protein ACIQUB_06280 [Rhizobium sp. NPDC090275]|uniref:hypothetical protein n=1 Tax=Rhizobium sp. NPDC090275 TaxID=3364498 RepID=UPI003839E7FE